MSVGAPAVPPKPTKRDAPACGQSVSSLMQVLTSVPLQSVACAARSEAASAADAKVSAIPIGMHVRRARRESMGPDVIMTRMEGCV